MFQQGQQRQIVFLRDDQGISLIPIAVQHIKRPVEFVDKGPALHIEGRASVGASLHSPVPHDRL